MFRILPCRRILYYISYSVAANWILILSVDFPKPRHVFCDDCGSVSDIARAGLLLRLQSLHRSVMTSHLSGLGSTVAPLFRKLTDRHLGICSVAKEVISVRHSLCQQAARRALHPSLRGLVQHVRLWCFLARSGIVHSWMPCGQELVASPLVLTTFIVLLCPRCFYAQVMSEVLCGFFLHTLFSSREKKIRLYLAILS